MDKEKWDSDEWQGRSKDKVEKNNKVFGYSILLTILGTVICYLYVIISTYFRF
jgi:hypothetical protein